LVDPDGLDDQSLPLLPAPPESPPPWPS